MIRKSLTVAAASAVLAGVAATPLGALPAPVPEAAQEAVRAAVPAERRVPAPAVVPAAPSPSPSRKAAPAAPSAEPVAPRPQAAPEAPRSVAPAQSPSRKPATPQRAAQPAPRPTETVTRIPGYEVCNVDPQPCVDRGPTLYGQPYGPGIIAAHNHMGYQWLSRLPVGRTVVVPSGPVAGTYRVTGHMRLNRQSGAIPSFGAADLVLQSCEGSGTGFSLLERVR